MSKKKPPRITRPTGSIHQHALRIADTVDEAWHSAHGHGDLDIPVSVVASLLLIAPPPEERDHAAVELLALDREQFAAVMRQQWSLFIQLRPDLINRAWPLARIWHGEPGITDLKLRGAHRVAHGALTQGLWHLSADAQTRSSLDLLGLVLTTLRGTKAAQAQGKYYSPAPLCEVIARLLGSPHEGTAIHEPAAGTGGMLRAMAQLMREHGRDPHTVTWAAVDIDELAVACLAVNAVLWNLGHRVLLGVGDTLTEDWLTRARQERYETVALAQQLRRDRRMLAALRQLSAPTPTPETESRQSPEGPDRDEA